MSLLYSFALALAVAISSPWWLCRMLWQGRYRAGLGERLGRVPPRIAGSPAAGCIWIHAVSVGEVLAISGLVARLRAQFPARHIFVSTTTSTGQQLARERFGESRVFYFPLDFAFAIVPYLRLLRPDLVVLAEAELWPNFLRLARASGARVAVVNARISDRSLPRYRRARSLLRRVLESVDVFLAQSEEDAGRLLAIGADPARVSVSGNLKFDVKPPQEVAFCQELRPRLAQSAAFPILVCGSTVEGEEFALLAAFKALLLDYPNAVTILAPRRPERFDEVAQLAASFGIALWRRSQLQPIVVLRAGVLLLDSIGELASLYSLATIAFVGGSLVPRGGHNILEPAYFGVPILVGPHTENFRDIVNTFQRAGALRVVRAFREGDAKGDLGKALRELLQDSAACTEMGRRAKQVLGENHGATERTLAALGQLLTATTASQQAAEPQRVQTSALEPSLNPKRPAE